MSLRRQLSLITTLLLLCLLTGNLLVSVYNVRNYFQEQLHSRAYDTATSLALSLNSVVDQADKPTLSSMMDVIFDRGFYREIRLDFTDQSEPLIRKDRSNESGAPNWFVALVPLEEARSETEVMSGWSRLGKLTVVSQPSFAYRDLWKVAQQEMGWFLIIAILSLVVLNTMLRILLAPLYKVEGQAMALSEKRFITLDHEPKSRELKRVVQAMNHMVRHLQIFFNEQAAESEALREQNFRDSLTGLGNRRGFDGRVTSLLEQDDTGPGVLLLLQLADFAEFNNEQGKTAGDQLLKQVADSLRLSTADLANTLIARRAGADFVLYLPASDEAHGEELAKALYAKLYAGPLSNQRFHMGAAYSSGGGNSLSNMLSHADLALRSAQQGEKSAFKSFEREKEEGAAKALQAYQWRDLLNKVLREQRLKLHFQPVLNNQGQLLHLEVLSRIHDEEGLINAATFWPMVERFNMSSAFDRLMIEQLIETAERQEYQFSYCINLSPASVLDLAFCDWLVQTVKDRPVLSNRLIFEISEHSIHLIEYQLLNLLQRLKNQGARMSIDHFGTGALAFGYLQRLPVEYLKVDKSFIRNITEFEDQQFFVQSMGRIAKGLGVELLAEGIETWQEWQQVQSLGINGGMGFYLCKPQVSILKVLSILEDWQPNKETDS